MYHFILPDPETGSISMTTFSDPETFKLFKKKKHWILFRKSTKFQTKSNQITNKQLFIRAPLVFQCKIRSSTTNKTLAGSYEILPCRQQSTQHPALTPAILFQLHIDNPSSLVRGPFQVSLFSTAVTGHLLKKRQTPSMFIFVWREGEVGYAL